MKKESCLNDSVCSGFSYSIYSRKKTCTFFDESSYILLKPSENEMTFIKSEFLDKIDDQSSFPERILVDISFSTNWLHENLNGIYNLTENGYEKKSLYNKTTKITLKRNNNGWNFKNPQVYGNKTILAKTSSIVDHPGLFMADDAKWMERITADTESLDRFPILNEKRFSPVDNRKFFITYKWLNLMKSHSNHIGV